MSKLLARVALPLGVLILVCAPAASAQDETPSFTTDDVAPPAITSPSVSPPADTPSASLGGLAGGLPAGALESALEALPPEFDVLKRRLLAGEEVGLAIRFDVSAAGKPERVTLERGTGIASLDRKILESFSENFSRAQGTSRADVLAGCNHFRVELGASRSRVAADLSADAASVERASELEEEGKAHLVVFRTYLKGDPDLEQLLRGLRLTRQGTRLALTADLDVALLERIAAKRGTR